MAQHFFCPKKCVIIWNGFKLLVTVLRFLIFTIWSILYSRFLVNWGLKRIQEKVCNGGSAPLSPPGPCLRYIYAEPPSPPSKWLDQKIYWAYVSEHFRTKKMYTGIFFFFFWNSSFFSFFFIKKKCNPKTKIRHIMFWNVFSIILTVGSFWGGVCGSLSRECRPPVREGLLKPFQDASELKLLGNWLTGITG